MVKLNSVFCPALVLSQWSLFLFHFLVFCFSTWCVRTCGDEFNLLFTHIHQRWSLPHFTQLFYCFFSFILNTNEFITAVKRVKRNNLYDIYVIFITSSSWKFLFLLLFLFLPQQQINLMFVISVKEKILDICRLSTTYSCISDHASINPKIRTSLCDTSIQTFIKE